MRAGVGDPIPAQEILHHLIAAHRLLQSNATSDALPAVDRLLIAHWTAVLHDQATAAINMGEQCAGTYWRQSEVYKQAAAAAASVTTKKRGRPASHAERQCTATKKLREGPFTQITMLRFRICNACYKAYAQDVSDGLMTREK